LPQVVLQEMAAAENELLETRTTPRGLLRVDAATPVMLHFLMPLVKPFCERYPEMTLSLVSSETFINLIERKVDVAIRVGTLTDSSLRARPLFTSYRTPGRDDPQDLPHSPACRSGRYNQARR
jgi:DNA-binding transcriptional LysR family regulator